MTAPVQDFLRRCLRTPVIVSSGDPRWEMIAELQRAGKVRLEWRAEGRLRTKQSASARIVVTDVGRAEVG